MPLYLTDEVIGKKASLIATSAKLRNALLPAQNRLAKEAPTTVVFDGRDIGTVVFPKADLKIFLTASLEVRAKRRLKQLVKEKKGSLPSLDAIIESLEKRDYRDKNRDISPLRKAKDAFVIDTSSLTESECLDAILDLINKVILQKTDS